MDGWVRVRTHALDFFFLSSDGHVVLVVLAMASWLIFFTFSRFANTID